VTIGGTDLGDDHRLAASMLEGEVGSSIQLTLRDSAGTSRTLTLIRQAPIVATPSNLPTEAGFGVRIERENGAKEAVVKCIAEGSAADIGGELQEGDIVTHIDGKSVVGMPCRYCCTPAHARRVDGLCGQRRSSSVRRWRWLD